jgi:glycosyltransferase involved in cell wall biosynthesis
MQKITLVSHTDTLTGAPRLLMDMADLLFEKGYHIDFVVKNVSGHGLLQLRKNAFDVFELRRYSSNILGKVKNLFWHQYSFKQFKNLLKNSDIVINNTIDNCDLLPYYQQYAQGKTITYLHELDAVIDTHLPTPQSKQNLVSATAHFIVPAQYIKERVAHKLNVASEHISVINSKVLGTLDTQHALHKAKKEGEFWVGMCGVADYRKGVDIFVKLGEILKNSYNIPQIKLVWLGFEGDCAKLVEEDIRKLGLEETLYLFPRTLHPDPFYAALDVFALTSREDPYPLVVLSAATAGKPIICFAQSGGSVDFVEDTCGYVVPYLDIDAFAEKIIYLFDNQYIRQQLGDNARKRVAERHHLNEPIFDQLNAVFFKIKPNNG